MTPPPTAPKDACPQCVVEVPVSPHQSRADDKQISGAYRCPDCGHTWSCSWLLSALPADAAGDAA